MTEHFESLLSDHYTLNNNITNTAVLIIILNI